MNSEYDKKNSDLYLHVLATTNIIMGILLVRYKILTRKEKTKRNDKAEKGNIYIFSRLSYHLMQTNNYDTDLT